MDRTNLEYGVRYSYQLERLSGAYLGRIDRFISFSQFCMGASVFAELANLKVVGGLLVAASAFALVYQPGLKAGLAELQAKRYQALMISMGTMSDDQLRAEYAKIQENDIGEIGALCNVAENREYLSVGADPPHTLSFREKVMGWIAGDLPTSRNST